MSDLERARNELWTGEALNQLLTGLGHTLADVTYQVIRAEEREDGGRVVQEVRVLGAVPVPSFACPRCGMTSHYSMDAVEGYCGNCHDWTGEAAIRT